MKGGQNLAILQQRKKEEEGWVKPQPCCICGKVIGGSYGSHEDGWTCSGKCEKEYNLRPKYPGHTEQEFFERIALCCATNVENPVSRPTPTRLETADSVR